MMNRKQNNVKVNKNSNKVELKETKTIILKTFKVSKENELLKFLFEHITNDSKNNIKKYLSNHQILVNGTCTTQFDFKIYKEDLVQLVKNPILTNKQNTIKLDIIYDDDELIIINKPSCLLSI